MEINDIDETFVEKREGENMTGRELTAALKLSKIYGPGERSYNNYSTYNNITHD